MINVLTDVSNTDLRWWETRLAGLRREWPANKLIGDLHFETMVTVDAGNLFVALPPDFTSVGDMNLLFCFTAPAFHSHHQVTFI